MTAAERWRWRGSIALLAVCAAFVIYPLVEQGDQVVNSDWPAFATGAHLIASDPSHLYDLSVQEGVERQVTGGRVLVTLGIHGILPFLAPAWVALVAWPFAELGTELGGRLWVLFGLACLALGLYLATRPRPPTAILPGFGSVPAAVMLLNAQLDGIVALGLGAAIFLWSRQYFAGLALGLTLMKPQLVLPVGAGLLATRRWTALAGWATSGVALWAAGSVFNPRWILEWLGPAGGTVQPGAREVDLPHLSELLPAGQTAGLALLTVVALAAVLYLASRVRSDMRAAAAVLIAGGVLAAPHALPADLVLGAVALAAWGRAQWFDWLLLSADTLLAALTPAPIPAFVGVVTAGWICARAAAVVPIGRQPGLEPWCAR